MCTCACARVSPPYRIKKAYRKKALELHPDRNYGDVERATRRFAEVQAAYEVLSDPHERAWYDSHRDAILRGDDPASAGDDGAAAAAPQQYRDVRLVTPDEIHALMGRFSKATPLDDSPGSFFTVLRELFGRISDGEDAAAAAESDEPSSSAGYPSFGTSQDDGAAARRFYAAWQGFSTRLGFAWRDRWRLSEAPDRRARRLMERENRRLREDAVREYSDAVRALVAFVRRRDPRYPQQQSEADRQRALRDAAAAQAARSRAAHREKLKRTGGGGDGDDDRDPPPAVPEWARSRGDGDEALLGEFSESTEESEVEHIECVVCGKTFKSERQYEAHEKSKKHIKAVQQLRRQMKRDNANLDLGDDDGDGDGDDGLSPAAAASDGTPSLATQAVPLSDDGRVDDSGVDNQGKEESDDDDDDDDPESSSPAEATTGHTTETAATGSGATATTVNSDNDDDDDEGESGDEDDEYTSRDAVEARFTGGAGRAKAKNPLVQGKDNDDDDQEEGEATDDLAGKLGDISIENGDGSSTAEPQKKKAGKAKARREKKAARQAAVAVAEAQVSSYIYIYIYRIYVYRTPKTVTGRLIDLTDGLD